jgi:M6 family metalloprotease-like protein
VIASCVVLLAGATIAAPAAPGKRGTRFPPPHSVSRDNLRRVQQWGTDRSKLGTHAVADSAWFIALRIDFPDLAFGASPPADEIHDRFYYQNHFRNLRQYFDAASARRFALQVEVADVVATAAHPAAIYGDVIAYDSLIVELTAEAVRAADPAVDFSRYDGVILIHAGPGQESDVAGDSPTQLWSGYLDATTFREQLSTPDSVLTGIATMDGVEVTDVILLPEWQVQDLQATGGTRFGSLGVYAHEIGQRLGMLPMFDATPAPFPDSQGLGNFDLMAYGLWVANGFIPSLPSAFNRMLVGWVDPLDVTSNATITLRDQERGAPDSVVVRVPISAREYFLVSYVLEDPNGRRADRPCAAGTCFDTLVTRRFFDFDNQDESCCFGYEDVDGDGKLSVADRIDSYAGAEWDFFLTDLGTPESAGQGAGLLVLHVDEQALLAALAAGSTNVNGEPRRKAVDVEEADAIEDLDRFPDNPRAFGSAADYFTPGRDFGPATVPDSRSADGAPTGITIALAGFPDSSTASSGPRARVRVQFDALSSSAAAPVRGARRILDGEHGADGVPLALGDGRHALVIPGDQGRLFLADASLDEAPIADGDATRLAPWVTVSPAWRGTWIGAPATGDVDGDGEPDVIAAARIDSLGQPITRWFGWRRDGRELRDLDGNPMTNDGVLSTALGAGSPPLLANLDEDAALEIVAAITGASGVSVRRFDLSSATAIPSCAGGPERVLAGGPVLVRPGAEGLVAWTTSDSSGANARLHFGGGECIGLGSLRLPVRMASGDCDANGIQDLVLVDGDGEVRLFAAAPPRPLFATRVAAASPTDLALADLDGDGSLEILFTSATAVHALSFTGAERSGWPFGFERLPALESDPAPGRDAAPPLVADVDGDGRQEVLVHLAGGALIVLDAGGRRRLELEATLPARAVGAPLVADLDGVAGVEMAAFGRFASVRIFDAPSESLTTAVQSEVAVWRWPRAAAIEWGQAGGDPGHTYRDRGGRTLTVRANDATLSSFVVGPNPASDFVRARLQLTDAATVSCALYTLEGERIHHAVRDATAGAIVEFEIDCRTWAPGIYFAQLKLSTGGVRTRPVAIRR